MKLFRLRTAARAAAVRALVQAPLRIMIEPQSMQDGASAWFTKLDWVRLPAADVAASPDPPATAPAAATGAGCVAAGWI